MSTTRHCAGCDRDLSLEHFAWKNKAQGTWQRWCRGCQARANKAHYQNNAQIYKDRAIARNYRVTTENRQKLYNYLSTHPCADCGNADIRVLEFDHIGGNKLANIANMLKERIPWSTIQAEIAKCAVRCVNCHTVKTSERAGWWRLQC